MPELPEVETTRRGIAPALGHATPQKAVVRQPRLRWPVDSDALQRWCGAPINTIQRRSKYLILSNDKGHLLIHLGMSGSLRVLPQDTPAQKHDHIDLLLDNSHLLRYTDPRRFGAWLVHFDTDPLTHPLLSQLGPEPLSEAFNGDHLYAACQKSRRAIKVLIMDSKVVVGVGNIYANEALFLAGIHPATPANTLTPAQTDTLAATIKQVLARAIEQGGTTLQDFTQPDGKPGYFAQQLNVYGHAGKPCPRCGTPIQILTLGQRSSFFCPRCQPV
ncbi:DNA-(apurinic or apyrimidinic site) lyase [Sulfurivirga caldicuralii]|uniref:Formamidopyrimidine-DNA glycosylase n=1 Tax=Sulfurivirga caldicuralii TaxID=364032 RepID=A0A1N6DMI3_9GAMM|nr:bifunctional DNA-formamidopyrimidine glycosylase/DNA-(apurinic or apyrimidinic site) lyase [Sulfurivirga caldicuralii]SIN72018.1 DNA-(apurinic or apyrimidinic site) lyase [Sulfurivirga caldicuralii]